jgi:hypothetical protein
MQAFAQPNESVKILITDAIEDLQNNDTNTALTHSNLASQELSSQGVSSRDSNLVLINDAIQDLLNNDTDTALVHLGLVNEKLESPSEDATTSAVSLNKTSELNTTLTERQEENTTAAQFANGTAIPEDMCTDNNDNGRCSLDAPRMPGYLCYDTDKDLYCDWFKAPKITSLGIKDCGTSFDDVDVNAMCEWFSDGTIELKPVAQNATTPQPLMGNVTDGMDTTGTVFSSGPALGDPFGDWYINIQKPTGFETCIDNNRNNMCDALEPNPPLSCRYDGACNTQPRQNIGERPPQQTGGNNTSEEYCEDFDGDGFCDITHSSDGSTIVEDQAAIERLKEGNEGSPDTQQQPQRQPSGSVSVPIQPPQNRINWGAICRNPIVDSFISEPCETLTSPDGYTLTPQGGQVLRCIGVGAAATLLAPEILASVKSLGPSVGCGSNTGGQPSPLGQGNPLDTMLGGLFRK